MIEINSSNYGIERVAVSQQYVATTMHFIRNAKCYAGHGPLENVAALRQISGGSAFALRTSGELGSEPELHNVLLSNNNVSQHNLITKIIVEFHYQIKNEERFLIITRSKNNLHIS